MSKKNETATPTATENKITRAQLLGCKVDSSAFDNAEGELFARKIILKLVAGEAAGPFKLVEILKDQDLTPVGAKKKMEPVDVYVGKTLDGSNTTVNMPAAASFVMKAKESGLAIGETFLVKRLEDYISKAYGKPGASYDLKITSRAKSAKK